MTPMAQRSRKRKRKNSKLRRQRRIILLMVVIIFVLAGVIAVSNSVVRKPQVDVPAVDTLNSTEETVSARKDGFYTILICGTDDGNGGSDTIMLASVDTENKAINVVSIPRDTLVNEDWTVKKINSAYNRSGIEGVEEQVAKIVGFKPDFYVTVDLKGFIELVDAIDGIDFEVPINMNYDDPAQNLHIHFTAGMQHLNGQQAMEVVRFRHNNDGSGYGSEDIGRMQTQQNFLKAVAQQTLTLSNVDKVGEFAKIFQQYVDTDLSLGNLAWLGKEAISMGVDKISFSTLPNEWRSPYIYLDPDATLELVNQYLNPYVEDRTMEDLDIPS